MKKFLNIALALGMLVMGTSCQRELATYKYADDVAGVTFGSDVQIAQMVAADGNKVLVTLYRGNTKGEVSIPVDITDETEGVFTPEKKQFDFKDGEASANIAFKYPSLEDFGGETYNFSLAIAESALGQVAVSGITEIDVQAQRKLTKVNLGTGAITDMVFWVDTWKQDIQTTEEAPNYFILPSAFADGVDVTFTVDKGVFQTASIIDLGYNYSATYGNYCMRDVTLSYDSAQKALLFNGYLSLTNLKYAFTDKYDVVYTLPEGFDVKKHFGIE